MMLFSIPARQTGKSLARRLLRTVSPARYLQLRRASANMSSAELGRRLSHLVIRCDDGSRRPVVRSAGEGRALVDLLETEGVTARHAVTIRALATVLPIDADVYRQLAEDPADRHPTVCRGCGCTDGRACDGDAGVCTWAVPGICTRCVDRGLAAPETL